MSRRSDGAPGDFIGERPVNSFIHPAGLPTTTSSIKVLRRPVESAQYSSGDFTDALADHDILASVGSTGDAYDNAMAESFVDTLKTELIADRRWPSRARLELALVRWVGWYNNQRLHGELGDIPPVEFEFAHQLHTLCSADLDERPYGPLLSTAGQAAQTKEVTT